ncbi:MAG: hypothetical protein ACRELF_17050 [Gemmataceae bacterium]
MTTAMQIMLKLQELPEEQQRLVLEFLDKLLPVPKPPRVDLYGLWKGYNTTEEEIAEARREMWGNSPGDDY